MKKTEKILEVLMDAIFPKTCPVCDSILANGQLVCRECKGKLQFIKEPRCKKCSKQLKNEEQEYCQDCVKSGHVYREGIAAFEYDDMMSKSIYKFKYHNRRTYAQYYGQAIAGRYENVIRGWQADVIIPVPVHKNKLIKRGYNQAELIAKELGRCLNMPVDSRYLVRIVNTKPQKEMSRNQRKKNLENAFKICSNVVKYKKIVLVDDIYTTGSTIDECARVLLKAGAVQVNFVSLSIGAGI